MTYSYATRDPKGRCGDPKRGASLGRSPAHATDKAAPIRFYLRQVPLDSGGYDSLGTYWGWSEGTRLYVYADGEGVESTLRARDRDAAKSKILEQYPKATFHR